MKTVNELKEKTSEELRKEARGAYEYWRRVRAFEGVTKVLEGEN